MKVVKVNAKGATRLRAGHLWVYSSDLVSVGEAHGGDIVEVQDERGKRLGSALYSDRSQIALRWVAGPRQDVTREFWRERLLKAAAYRERVVEDTNAYRLVFADSDLLSSLIVDRYDDCFVIQTLSQGMEQLKSLWVDLLVEQFSPRAVIERNETKVRTLEGLPMRKGVLYGELPQELCVSMNGLKFQVNLLEGQKTGAFLDQRENYRAAAHYAKGRALDCFSFAGGFALHLARHCESVLALDISPDALGQARRNAEVNSLANVALVEANVFDYLHELNKKRERFDVIVLDPPAFAKSRAAIESAVRGYKEINLRALRLLQPGGILVTCSCSYHLNEEMLLNVLVAAAADAGRQVRIIERRTQARDHPILLSMPETCYLKCVIVQVL
jgi:23S rRNA (cytosine1962-C5)-methyltransferase